MAKGISNETRSTSLKKFKPNPNINGGLSIGALTDVLVGSADIKSDSGMTTFQGMTIPRISFVFESREDLVGVKPSTYIHSYLPIEHTPESITKEGSWRYEQMSQTIKHFLDVFRDNALLTKEDEAKLLIDFEDEDNGLFIEQPADVVIAAYEKFFNGVVSLFKGDGKEAKAIYKDTNGKDKVLWMKLLLDIKGNQVNRGDYAFPGYPGEGLIEIKKPNVPPSLSINIAKGENIIAKAFAAPNHSHAAANSAAGAAPAENENIPTFMR